jgi:hypothetical protein
MFFRCISSFSLNNFPASLKIPKLAGDNGTSDSQLFGNELTELLDVSDLFAILMSYNADFGYKTEVLFIFVFFKPCTNLKKIKILENLRKVESQQQFHNESGDSANNRTEISLENSLMANARRKNSKN